MKSILAQPIEEATHNEQQVTLLQQQQQQQQLLLLLLLLLETADDPAHFHARNSSSDGEVAFCVEFTGDVQSR